MVGSALSACSDNIITTPPTRSGYGCLGEQTKLDDALGSALHTNTEGKEKEQKPASCFFNLSWTVVITGIIAVLVLVLGRQYLRSLLTMLGRLRGWQSALIFLILFTIVCFPMTFGYFPLNVACGYFYGFWAGTTLVVGCVTLGVTVSLVVCRRWLRQAVQSRLESEHLRAVMRVVEGRQGFRVVALTRLTPIPFGLQNGLFAITSMPVLKCTLASCLGLLPTQIINTYVGTTLRNMEEIYTSQADSYVILVVQVVVTGCLLVYVFRRARHEINKAMAQSDTEHRSVTVEEGRVVNIKMKSMPRTASSGTLASKFSSSNGHVTTQVSAMQSHQQHRRTMSATNVLLAVNEPRPTTPNALPSDSSQPS
ncbi:transmembrane protein 64-like [Sycon ciliatum]|uniref:transmembrane protein 64-like n=1 Tax=Sycon ciliatum TaxID=27933 RepID=UPI0020ACECDC|eukprot:scpid57022/ scgid13082/ Transmembrane protein 64